MNRGLLASMVVFLVAVGTGGCGASSGDAGPSGPSDGTEDGSAEAGVAGGENGGDGGTSIDGSGGMDSTANPLDGGSVDATGSMSDAAGADAAWGPPTAWVYNIVDSAGVSAIASIVSGSSADLTATTKEFYQTFADDYDFLYLFAEVPAGTGDLSTMVRWDGTSGVGIGAAFDDQTWGSAARLKQVIALGTLLNGVPFESGPTLHETLHHWSMYLDSSFGFDTATGHWGRASADGLHGGFNRDSVLCRDNGMKPTGTVPACPLNSSQRMNVSTAPFSPCCVADIKPYSPVELYLMGLVPKTQVAPLWVMDSPVYDGPVTTDAGVITAMNFDIASFHVVTVDDIIAKEGMRPAATQTAFRAAFVLVTSTTATTAQMERIARWARRFSGEEVDPTTGIYSFSRATGGLATMTTKLKP